MKNKNVKVIDEHNIDRNANVMFAVDLNGSEYVVYWIMRDEESNNIFVSKVLKNLDGTYSMLNIDDADKKSEVAENVKYLISSAVSDENDKLVGMTKTLSNGEMAKFINVSFNKEQNINVPKTYITTVKKEVTRVVEDYYDVVTEEEKIDNVLTAAPVVSTPEVVETITNVAPQEVALGTQNTSEPISVIPTPVVTEQVMVAQSSGASVVTETPVVAAVPPVVAVETPVVAQQASAVAQQQVQVAQPAPVVTESVVNVAELPGASVVTGTPVVAAVTPAVAVETPVVAQSAPAVAQQQVQVVQSAPVVTESVVNVAGLPGASVVTGTPVVAAATPAVAVETPIIVQPAPAVAQQQVQVAQPAPVVTESVVNVAPSTEQPLVFNASKETNLNAALGEVANSATIPVENINVVREFGEEVPLVQTVTQPAIAPMVQSQSAVDPKVLVKKAGFANSKFFMVIAIAFFMASCVFLGYEVFNYFQLTK